MIRTAIVEDNPKARADLWGFLERYGRERGTVFEITEYTNADDFLEETGPSYELVFMDIEMPGTSGMDAAKKLRERDNRAVLLFVTNMANFAIKGYEVDALDFLLKPVSYETICFRLDRAVKALEVRRESTVSISFAGGVRAVKASEFLYAEVQGHKLSYHLVDDVISVRGTLSDAEELLEGEAASARIPYLQSNRYCLVNPMHIKMVDGYSIYLDNGEVLDIARARKSEFLKDLAAWISRGGG